MVSQEEAQFSVVASDATPEHIRWHLQRANNRLTVALDEHFEGRCGKFAAAHAAAVAARRVAALPAGAAAAAVAVAPVPVRRDRDSPRNADDGNDAVNARQVAQQPEAVLDAAPVNADAQPANAPPAAAVAVAPPAKIAPRRNNAQRNVGDDASTHDDDESDAGDNIRGGRGAARGGRGGRGRGAGGRGRGRLATSSDDDDGDSSTSSSGTSDDSSSGSGSSSEDTSSGDDTHRRRGRGRGRGAGVAAARPKPAGKGRPRKVNVDGADGGGGDDDDVVVAAGAVLVGEDGAAVAAAVRRPAAKPAGKRPGAKRGGRRVDESLSPSPEASEDEDSSSDDDDAAGGGVAARQQRIAPGRSVATAAVRRFEDAVAIPFTSAAQDNAAWQQRLAELRNDAKLVVLEVADEANAARIGWINTDHKTLPVLVTSETVIPPAPDVVAAAPLNCPCLWSVSETCLTHSKRRLLAHAVQNRVLRTIAPAVLRDEIIKRNNDNKFIVCGVNDKKRKDFAEKFGEIIECPADKRNIIVFRVGIHYEEFFVYTGDTVVTHNQIGWREYLPPSLRTRPDVYMCHSSHTWLSCIERPFEAAGQHLWHQLYLRLRAASPNLRQREVGDGLHADVSFHTLGNTSETIWARRFAAWSVALVLLPKDVERAQQALHNATVIQAPADGAAPGAVATPATTLSQGFYDSLYTLPLHPETVLSMARELHKLNAKQIFESFGVFLTRPNTDISAIPVRPRGINVDLHPHQRRSIAFMMNMERHGVDQFLHTAPFLDANKASYYRLHINSVMGAVVATAVGSPQEAEIMRPTLHRGGFLADEVGMGKTLSIISLILLNQPVNENNANAPFQADATDIGTSAIRMATTGMRNTSPDEVRFAGSARTKLRVRATLVIAPVSLVGQWETEIAQRAPGMRVLRFHGTQRRSITYADIAAADVVITTFETYKLALREETFWLKWYRAYRGAGGHVLRNGAAALGVNMGNNQQVHGLWSMQIEARIILRKQTNYRPDKSRAFISRIHFHRIVLDEFHKPGGLNDDMVLVDSSFLWLVSGTPLDANFESALKRMGVMDYSFVPPDRVRFCSNTVEQTIPQVMDRRFFEDESNVGDALRDKGARVHFKMPYLETYVAPRATVSVTLPKLAILSRYMVRNTIDTCPELSNVRVTERIVKLTHTASEKKKYDETLAAVRTEMENLRARGRVNTRILEMMRLLNDLRRAAVDPFGVTVQVRDALQQGHGAQFENENARRAMVVVPVMIFAHIVFPEKFPLPTPESVAATGATDAQRAPTAPQYAHVKKVVKNDTLKDDIEKMQRAEPELPTCPICMESVMSPVVTECGHIFCRECLLGWMRQGNGDNKCPNCRKPTLADAKKKSVLTFPLPPVEDNADAAAAENAPPQDIPTKFLKVLEIVRGAIQTDDKCKFVIFTSYPTCITGVKNIVTNAGIGCVVIDGSSTLSQRSARIQMFQDPASFNVRVCIISSRVGNSGLTLTAANHLIILEPTHNIDVDIQTIGRVKRLGQKRPVTVHRLLVENTIEISLFAKVQDRTLALRSGGNDAARQQAVQHILQLLYPDGVPAAPVNGIGGGGGNGEVYGDSDSENWSDED